MADSRSAWLIEIMQKGGEDAASSLLKLVEEDVKNLEKKPDDFGYTLAIELTSNLVELAVKVFAARNELTQLDIYKDFLPALRSLILSIEKKKEELKLNLSKQRLDKEKKSLKRNGGDPPGGEN